MKPTEKLKAITKPVADALAEGKEKDLRRLAADLKYPGGPSKIAGELLELVLEHLTGA